jgi:hypothetical protein
MKLFDKVMILLGFVSMLLVMWHVFTPKSLQIDGFYGIPMYICMCIVGYSFHLGLEKIR